MVHMVRASFKNTVGCKPVSTYDDVIKWKHFPSHWSFALEIHWSPVNSPHKGQWRGALMLSLICAWINGWVKNLEAGDLSHLAHFDVSVMREQIFIIRLHLSAHIYTDSLMNNIMMNKYTLQE